MSLSVSSCRFAYSGHVLAGAGESILSALAALISHRSGIQTHESLASMIGALTRVYALQSDHLDSARRSPREPDPTAHLRLSGNPSLCVQAVQGDSVFS
jgi:hypothetical protein